MTKSSRFATWKIQKFDGNITKRGAVPRSTSKKKNNYSVGPVLLGLFIFVIIGSKSSGFWDRRMVSSRMD